MNYESFSKLPRSEKITLITCEAVQLAKLFNLESGNIYSRQADFFVSNLKPSGEFQKKNSLDELIAHGDWFFDASSKKLYLYSMFNPKQLNIAIAYKLFFSTAPIILPHDLNSGVEVEWLPLVENVGSIGQQLDDENTGIVLESQSQINFINNHGFFDPIFDTLIWENQNVSFYSWSPLIPLSEAKRIFTGVVESKDFQVDRVIFKVKDFVFRLKNRLKLDLFTEDDGVIPDSYLGTPKRRIYGRADRVRCIPIDATLEGYPLTGTISITEGSLEINGSGTNFLKEMTPGDELILFIEGTRFKVTIDAVQSSTLALLSRESEFSVLNASAIISPERPYRFKNRLWHIAGHRIRSSTATITNVFNARAFSVDDVSEFSVGDTVSVGFPSARIVRISSNQIILSQNLPVIPSEGDLVTRFAVTRVFFGSNQLVPARDFVEISSESDSIIELTELAEFNIARERLSSVNLIFTQNSRDITTNETVDLRTIIQPRDWIRRSNAQVIEWYEVLSVEERKITLRSNYNQATATAKGLIKNVELIDENSLILVDCYGKDLGDQTTRGTWIRTASDAVKDLVVNDAEFDDINEESFSQAKSDCNYTLSMVLPESIGQDAPTIRETISQINESVFGSLYGNSSQEICFSIVNTRRDVAITPVKDDDILSFSVQSSQKIVNQVILNYSPFVDNVTGEDGFKTVSYISEFVNNNIGIQNSLTKTAYLYDQKDAIVIAQRMAFYNSLSQSTITLRAKANFFTSSVNDRIYLDLDRLYRRFGGQSKGKIGIVSGVRKGAFDSEVIVNDLGNIFNRCPVIAPNDSASFTFSSEDEKIKLGYVLDSQSFTPDPSSEQGLGGNLIG
jgi:hypothetical protein